MNIKDLTNEQLLVLANAGLIEGAKPAKSTKRKPKATSTQTKRKTTANVTEGFLLSRDPRSDEFGIEYGVLEFLDGNDKPHTGALREDDVLGKELIAEIKSYASAHAVGRSKIRYNRKLNAWTGRMDMFPARLRKLAGIA